MTPPRLFVATGNAVARIDFESGVTPTVALSLENSGAQCITVDPRNPERVYAGTFNKGVYRSLDGGESWEPVSDGIPHKRIPSIAISPSHVENGLSVVYAGTEPSNLYRSVDDGKTWKEFSRLPELPSALTWSFPPRPWTSHVRWIALSYHDPNLIFAGIELGGVMRSTDAGETWEDRKPGSQHDSHAIATHPVDPNRVYEAAGGGIAISLDAGDTWQPEDEGMDRHYCWALAVDPVDPELWYVSATYGARHAHREDGDSSAQIYRRAADSEWEELTINGATEMPNMPYALLVPRDAPGTLIAGFRDGELMHSPDRGNTWSSFGVLTPGILGMAEAAS
jgi:photosystem II stability/assembly factor-like uncharacterized protein